MMKEKKDKEKQNIKSIKTNQSAVIHTRIGKCKYISELQGETENDSLSQFNTEHAGGTSVAAN